MVKCPFRDWLETKLTKTEFEIVCQYVEPKGDGFQLVNTTECKEKFGVSLWWLYKKLMDKLEDHAFVYDQNNSENML